MEDSELRNQQLHHELERSLPSAQTADISLPGSRQAHNPTCLGQLSLLPPELLLQCLATTRYRSGRLGGTVADYLDTTSRYIDISLLLVSWAVRRTTLDILFARDHFVFTYRYDLRNFASKFPLAATRVQSLRLCHTVDDFPRWDFPIEEVACMRRLFKSFRHLEFSVLLNDYSPYESIYVDGFLKELCHFRRPLPESFKCGVQWLEETRYGRKLGLDEEILERVQEKFIKIFTGVYGDEIPISTPPPRKVREADAPLSNEKGITA